jgi:hypothetical protein
LVEGNDPTGDFHGTARNGVWRYYGMNNQQIEFKSMNGEHYPEKMTAKELIALKGKVKNWEYSPRGSLF